MTKKFFSENLVSAEQVGKGHPDKICDQIADAILDFILEKDPESRVACEVFACNRLILIGGEIKTKIIFDPLKIAWKILQNLGYLKTDFSIISNINSQSLEIAKGVNKKKLGAGDQGIVYGFATNETKKFLPLAYVLACAVVNRATKLIEEKKFLFAKYDMKTLVVLQNKVLPKVKNIIFSVQHKSIYDKKKFLEFIKTQIINPVLEKYKVKKTQDFHVLINPTGSFVNGGPFADTGLTGRKIIADSYGSFAKHGGGAFSGKDYTKVDRSGAYFARWIAKNLVAAEVCNKIEIGLSYAIGQNEPIAIEINTFKSARFSDKYILKIIESCFETNLEAIVKWLDLKKVKYSQTAWNGHFTKKNLPWEKLNKVLEIKKFIKENSYKK